MPPAAAAAAPAKRTNKTMDDQIVSALVALNKAIEMLGNDGASHEQRKQAADGLVDVKTFLLQRPTTVTQNNANTSRVSRMNYALKRTATLQKNTTVQCTGNRQQADPLEETEAVDENSASANQTPAKTTPTKPLPTTKQKHEAPIAMPLPEPANGTQYTRVEFLRIITAYPTTGKIKRSMAMQEAINKKYVPLSASGLYRTLKKLEQHIENGGSLEDFPDGPWNIATRAIPMLQMELAAVPDGLPGKFSPSKPPTKKRKLDVPSVTLPKPANGTQYTRVEFLRIITAYPTTGKIKRSMAMQEAMDKKYVPCSASALYNSLKNLEHHIEKGGSLDDFPDEPWKIVKVAIPMQQNEPAVVAKPPPTNKRKPDVPPITLPKPANGTQYTRVEFLRIITPYPTTGKIKRSMAMQEVLDKKYVPCSASVLYKLLKNLEQHVEKGGSLDDFPDEPWKVLPSKPPPTKKQKADVPSIALPKPANGTIYTKVEFLRIITPYPTTGKLKRSMAMQEVLDKKYVPCSASGLYKLLKNLEQHVEKGGSLEDFPDEPWKTLPPRAPPTKKQKPDVPSITLPKPANGTQYTRVEFLKIITPYPTTGKLKRSVAMQEAINKKYVPLTASGLYLILKKLGQHIEKGGSLDDFPDEPWYIHKGTTTN
ncbi:expressed unknown protein [Seminavis robusta]|uniref:Uncharacterized protein n=1 Tax=Seminavis robusta TaxID=568900 RepID=A0A9N8D7N2_9STRA|nr:expressed unknown protein [Seminavis robusta]|eukprot:Sro31_g020050.1 n/a (652) ;mRNA; r:17779-19734